MAHYRSSPGAIYPALRRLEQKRWIAGVVDSSRPLRPKRVYRPTPRGVRELAAWASRPVTATTWCGARTS